MKRNAWRLVLAIMLVSGFGFFATPLSAGQEKGIHLKFSTWHPPAGREVKTVWEPMLEEMKRRSNGRITYTLYAGSALGAGPAHFDIVKDGLSDMGYFTSTWTPGRFPLSDVLSLATAIEGKDIAVDIGNEMHDKKLEQEFAGVKVLELNGCISSYLWTKKPVHNLEDVKGLKIRTPGGFQTNYIKSLGAEPVFMPLGDVYLALETGTLDGVVTCPPLVIGFKLHEVTKYGVITPFGCVTEGVIMNEKTWARTPDDLKQIILDVASNPFETTGGLDHNVYGDLIGEIQAKGAELYTLPADEADRWAKGFQEVTKAWVAEMEGQGKPAREAVEMYKKILDEKGIQCPAYPMEWQ
ncbi:MAG: TRAP transporter substrate-binding protein [Desulfobacterales bacterium]